mgnify:CR=1 FL=1
MTAHLPKAEWTQRASLAKLVETLGADDIRWVGGCVRDTMPSSIAARMPVSALFPPVSTTAP